MAYDADAIVIGAGLAGLVAATELADAGKRVIILDQEPEQTLGGQAWRSFGGLFFVDSPEQRRLRIRDSRALALQDWMGSAAFDRDEDHWPRQWAEAYIDFAAGEKRVLAACAGHALVSRCGMGRTWRIAGHRAWQFRAALSHHLGNGNRRGRAIHSPCPRGRTKRAHFLPLPAPGDSARHQRGIG